ncbi:MAG TPA: hypothetical protein PLQ94_05315, partial [Anaerolineales bacterium]|nr:hypothetical protein [Anaerolineales bacterium]
APSGWKRGEKCAGDEKIQEAVEDEVSDLVPIRKVIDRINEIREEICVGENDKTNNKSQEQRGKISHD